VTKPQCRDLEPLLASYVDDMAEPDTRAAVDAHLSACPPCRDRAAAERAARDLVRARRDSLRGCASEGLKHRCAEQSGAFRAIQPSPARRPFLRRTLVPLSLAATVVLVVATFFFAFSRNAEVLAAQLAADHVKCFKFNASDTAPRLDAAALSREWMRTRGWPISIPASTPDHNLVLVDVRRCGSTDGPAAHLMYTWRGAPLSVYVMNSESRRARTDQQFVQTLGQHAVVWKDHGRTYVIVADGAAAELAPVVRYVRSAAK
jgi:anti-sigma factor RsiW